MFSAGQGNLKEVRKLLQTKKNLDINRTNKEGFTSLALAIRSGNFAVVNELVAARADVNISNNVSILIDLTMSSCVIFFCEIYFLSTKMTDDILN